MKLAAVTLALATTACTDAPIAELTWDMSPSSRIKGCDATLHAARLELYQDWPRPMRTTMISCRDGVDTTEPYPEATEICYVAAKPGVGLNECETEDYLGIPCTPSTYEIIDELGPRECFAPAALEGDEPLQVNLWVW